MNEFRINNGRSSPNELIECFMKVWWQGPGKKGRLRGMHRRDKDGADGEFYLDLRANGLIIFGAG